VHRAGIGARSIAEKEKREESLGSFSEVVRRAGRVGENECRFWQGRRDKAAPVLLAVLPLGGRQECPRDAGISVGRSATRNGRPLFSYSLRISFSRLATTCPSRGWPSFSLPAREDSVVRGANSTRFALTRPAKSSTCVTVSRASSASLIFRPSPWPLEAPRTAQLRLSEAEADATCEHQRNRAGEAVLVGLNFGVGSICFEIQFRIPYVMREWTASRRE
jgi:hypothetical protein